MKNFTQKYQLVLIVLLAFFSNIYTVQAQCDMTKMTVTHKHALCTNDGSIMVSVPGTCDTQIVLRIASNNAYVEAGSLTSDGTNSTITFNNLEPNSYKIFHVNGSTEIPYTNNPVEIKNVYIPMEIDPYVFTHSTCKEMSNPDGTIRIRLKTGTGTGPFIYELTTTRGTQTSAPTSARDYTFGDNYTGNGVLSNETVSVTVTDTKNGACNYAVTQQPVVPTTTNNTYVSVLYHHFIETANCDEFNTAFRTTTYNNNNSQSSRKIYEFLQIPGNAIIEVTPADGSAPYTANLTMDAGGSPTSSYRYFQGPTLKKGDKYTVTLKDFCGGTDRKTSLYTVNPANLYVNNQSSLTVDPETCETIELVKLNYYYSTYYYYLKKPNGELKLYKKEGADWVETQPKEGELSFNIYEFPNTSNSNSITLHDWGTYKLEYTDACGVRFFKEITLTKPELGYFSIYPAASMHGNTGGIDVHISNFNYVDSLLVRIDSKAGPEVKTFLTSKPFSGETYEQSIVFPYEFKVKLSSNSWVHINDIPEGEYTLTVTDKCNISYSRDFRRRSTDLVRYNPKNTDYYVNGIRTEFGCSNSNRIFLDFGSNNKEQAYVTLYNKDNNNFYKTDGTPVSSGGSAGTDYKNEMSFSNLPPGEYELHFYRFWYSGINYSLILNENYKTSYSPEAIRNIVPVTIIPYAELDITNYSSMCDPVTDSGMIDTRIISGTPVYPIRYELFNKNTGTKINEYIDETFGSKNHLFTGLPKGTYMVRVSNGYNQTLGTSCGTTEGDVVVQDFGVPAIVKSRDNIYVGDNSTLSIAVSPAIYNVTWYKVVGEVDTEIGTGTSITVSPDAIGTHTYKAELKYTPETPCGAVPPHIKTTTLTVLEKNFWMGGKRNVLG